MKKLKKRCYNCKYAGRSFKIGKMTYLHCNHPKLIPSFNSEWDSLREFHLTCEYNLHEFKIKQKKQLKNKDMKATVRQFFDYISGLNPTINCISSLGEYVSETKMQVANNLLTEIITSLPEDTLAYNGSRVCVVIY